MDDWQLLNNYATRRSEEAFRALVERYAGMVYHAALRQTGNPDSAEEAAQVVFIALAQKAGKISRQTTLYGWLFRAIRFAVSNQARQNTNRQRREQEALAMQSTMETNDADSLWERITPLLDDALEKLSASDRELVMIRFFGNKSHKDVAQALGVSEETARKRISRAIEKLRVIFSRQGVVVSSLALASAFAVHGAKAAPGDAVSSWANVAMAKAAAGVGGTSAAGILSFEPAAMSPGLIAAVVGSVIVAAAVFIAVKSTYNNSPALAPSATNLANATGAPDAKAPSPEPETSPEPAKDTKTNTISAAALDKVKAALHDPNPTEVYPNSVMQQAIAALGDTKKLAIPILEAALNDADFQVRLRAIDGLGMVGAEAKEAAPLLLGLLRDDSLDNAIPQTKYVTTNSGVAMPARTINTGNMIVWTLGQIHPSSEILPALAQMVKENPSACYIVAWATAGFSYDRMSMQGGSWLWAVADGNVKALNNAFRPLLTDPNPQVRQAAASSLVSALGTEADAGVFPVAIEELKGGHERQGLMLLENAARDLSTDGSRDTPILSAPRLGSNLNETVSALANTANHTTQERLRVQASRMLDALSPDFRKLNPSLANELEQNNQAEAFARKVQNDEVTTSEILEGLKKFPKAAPAIADYFVRNGSNVIELLPAFSNALSALAFTSEATQTDGDAVKEMNVNEMAANARRRLADAMQKIAPNLPKPIFTFQDSRDIRAILVDPALRADPDRFQKVVDASDSAGLHLLKLKPFGFFEVSPDQVRRLLAAVKEADATTYDALIAKVKEIDPHFFDAPLQ